jgi:hypothetical protein
LYLTNHAYIRSKERGIIPEWLHKQTANDFILGLINQTNTKQIIKYGDQLTKIVVPQFKAYIREDAIVTLVSRRKARAI